MEKIKIALLLVIILSSGFAQDGLVAFYPFNGNGNDMSINGHDAEIWGPTITNDRFDVDQASYNCDGADDYIDTGVQFRTEAGEGFSLVAWFMLQPGDLNSTGVLIGSGSGLQNTNKSSRYLSVYASGELNFGIRWETDESGTALISTTELVDDGLWHQTIGVYDGSTQQIKLYLDGQLRNSAVFSGAIEENYNILIGAMDDSGGYGNPPGTIVSYFAGSIDDISIYSRALQEAEIDSLFRLRGWPIDPNPLNDLVQVPAGDFTYGPTADVLSEIDYTYGIMKYEATNAEYAQFLNEFYAMGKIYIESVDVYGGYDGDEEFEAGDYLYLNLSSTDCMVEWDGMTFYPTVGYSNYPVVHVSWFGAKSFAKHYNMRLPTDKEWEKAARGNTGAPYPWGDMTPSCDLANYLGCGSGILPVGSTSGASPFGAFDMAGNVYEWVDTKNPDDLFGREHRGGGFTNDESDLYTYARFFHGPENPNNYRGFRCLRDDLTYVSLGHASGYPGETVSIPVHVDLSPFETFDAVELTFANFNESLSFVGVETAGGMLEGLAWNVVTNEVDDLQYTAFAGTDDISGSGILCYLQFQITGQACDLASVDVVDATFNTNNATEIVNGLVEVLSTPIYGDVDQNGMIQAHDASLILKEIVGIVDFDCQEFANADVDTNSAVEAIDATNILRHVVHLNDSFPIEPAAPDLLAVGSISLPEETEIQGHQVRLAVDVEAGENLMSIEIAVEYDPELLLPSNIPTLWHTELAGFGKESNFSDGEIYLAAANASGLDLSGTVVTLCFNVISDVSLDGSELRLRTAKLNANIEVEDITSTLVDILAVDNLQKPEKFSLEQNFPNPFNPSTTIRYGIPEAALVKVEVFNITGHLVKTMVSELQHPGFYEIEWNSRDHYNHPTAAGVYLCRVQAGDYQDIIKMIQLK